jgi:D-alanyl-lipoteichoic acid acyltransferase DltB (MBOAT superfamily)
VAIGIAKWMGFTIPPNFLSPYQSKNITEFWRRWHISLSSWLRDYLYIPLGGNRKGKVRMYVNLMITMLLGGLWHGASWNFVLWGGMHGVALALHKLYTTKTGRLPGVEKYRRFSNAVSVFITFNFVCFCWIFFKSDSFETAGQMIYQITHDFDAGAWSAFFNNYKTVLGMMLLAALMHAIPDNFADKLIARFNKVPLPVYMVIFFVFVLVYGYFKAAEPVMPIYLQF